MCLTVFLGSALPIERTRGFDVHTLTVGIRPYDGPRDAVVSRLATPHVYLVTGRDNCGCDFACEPSAPPEPEAPASAPGRKPKSRSSNARQALIRTLARELDRQPWLRLYATWDGNDRKHVAPPETTRTVTLHDFHGTLAERQLLTVTRLANGG